MIVVAMIWILGATGVWYLDRQPLSLNTSIAQFDAMLNLARTHASAFAGGMLGSNTGTFVVAETGATLYVEPDAVDPTRSMITIYKYRPIPMNHCQGCVEADASVPVLRLPVRITATIPSSAGGATASAFAVFVSPSQHLSAIAGIGSNSWDPGSSPLDQEPLCDDANPPLVTFISANAEKSLPLSCDSARLTMPLPQPMAN